MRGFSECTADAVIQHGRCAPARTCQVHGCDVDVSTEGKRYFVKKRVCLRHMRADAVQLDGHGSKWFRFCHQHGKFEPLSCFDGHKRSCRERLERRRQVLLKHRAERCQDDAPDQRSPDAAGARRDGDRTRIGGAPQAGAPFSSEPACSSGPCVCAWPEAGEGAATASASTSPDAWSPDTGASALQLRGSAAAADAPQPAPQPGGDVVVWDALLQALASDDSCDSHDSQLLRELEAELNAHEQQQQQQQQPPAAQAGVRSAAATAAMFVHNISGMLEPHEEAVAAPSAHKLQLLNRLTDALCEEPQQPAGLSPPAAAAQQLPAAGRGGATACGQLVANTAASPAPAHPLAAMPGTSGGLRRQDAGGLLRMQRLAALQRQVQEVALQLQYLQETVVADQRPPPGAALLHQGSLASLASAATVEQAWGAWQAGAPQAGGVAVRRW